jgi:hypothetical protein
MSRIIPALLASLALAACGTTDSSIKPVSTRGVVVNAQMDHTWIAVQQACSKLSGGSQTLEATARRATMHVGAVGVTIVLTRHTSGGVIIRVDTDTEGLSGEATQNRVITEIQNALR